MSLQLHNNNAAREGRPSIWIFQGPVSLTLLVIGAALFIFLFRILANLDIDWPVNIALSAVPLAAVTLFVALLVNGKPPSYASDLLFLSVYRLKAWLFKRGALDQPPTLWVLPRPFNRYDEF